MTTNQSSRFIPLSATSQNSHKNVLYYDSHTSVEAILECANARLNAVVDLLGSLNEHGNIPAETTIAICVVSKLLFSDTFFLLSAFKAKL